MKGTIIAVFSIMALVASEPPRLRSFARQQQRWQPQRTSFSFERQEIQPEEPKPSYGPPAPSYGPPPEYGPPAAEEPTTEPETITTTEPQSEQVPANTTNGNSSRILQPQNNFFFVLPQQEKYVVVNRNEPIVAVGAEALTRIPSEPVFALPAESVVGIPPPAPRFVPARIIQAPITSNVVTVGEAPRIPFSSRANGVATPYLSYV